jgi:hypothetical protein
VKPVYEGGRGASFGLIGLGAVLLAATVLAGGETGRYAYLFGFAYWLAISLAGLVFVMISAAAKARWVVAIRRPLEAISMTVVLFAVLFIPLALWVKQMYPWAGPTEGLDDELQHLIHHRAVWLNVPFFYARAALYLGIFILFAFLFWKWSTSQDQDGASKWTLKAWKLGPGGLPLMGLALTFAAMDWLMSLNMLWFSSVWGVYYFAGGMVSMFSLWVIILVRLEESPSYQGTTRPAHWLSLGKFMLAFTCFWAYIAFSQYMLTWVANLPDSIPYLHAREHHGWSWVGIGMALGHFVIPFFILLQRWIKLQPKKLQWVGVWILLMHGVDMYWVIMPQVRPEQPALHWTNLTAWAGVGMMWIGVLLTLMYKKHMVPVKDPFLPHSMEYSKL